MAASSSKGNPANHRMNNPKLKEKRARSWAAGERKKVENRKANNAAHTANVATLSKETALAKSLGVSTDNKRPSKVLRNIRRAVIRDLDTIS